MSLSRISILGQERIRALEAPLQPHLDRPSLVGGSANRYGIALLGYFFGALAELRKRDVELTAALGRGERLAVLGELSAALAHELRNPLAMLRSSLQNSSEAEPNVSARCEGMVSDARGADVAMWLLPQLGDSAHIRGGVE